MNMEEEMTMKRTNEGTPGNLRDQPIGVWREALAKLEVDRQLRSGADLSKGGHWIRANNEKYARSLYPAFHPKYGNVWRSAKVSEDHYVIVETYDHSDPVGSLFYRLGIVVNGQHEHLLTFHGLRDARAGAARHWRGQS
jgi:hypothetical protein